MILRSNYNLIIIRIAFILLFFALWHISQNIIFTYKSKIMFDGGILDQVMHATRFINEYLNEHTKIAATLIVLTSLEVDILTLFIFFYSIFSKSARLLVGLVFMMLLRQFCQALCFLPFPQGMIWFDPGFPTLFVTYGVTNDFFFSGHTALTVYAAIAIGEVFKKNRFIVYVKYILILFQCFVIVILRGHYFMDIFTAIFVAIVAYIMAHKINLPHFLDVNQQR